MSAKSYAALAATVFTIVSLLQLLRALSGWPVAISGIEMPLWPSWVAFLVAGLLAWLGFAAWRRG
jgi:hypothetical protein